MAETIIRNEELSLDDSVKVNNKGEAILGRLEGPCADFITPTRNGRMYDETLWEKVFNSEIIKEYFECGGIPGELDHPADRQETCSEKIAIMMPEPPRKNSDGQLVATFDILNTPCGKIAYTLAKYGYKLGISSRGSGDTYTAMDGNEHVDEDTYDFQAFDLVLLPAVKAARLKMVESLDTTKKAFRKAICEALDTASVEDRKIMEDKLKELEIDYSPEKADNKASSTESEADNVGSDLVKDLQEALKEKQKLEGQLTELQEKLSVSYAMEARLKDSIERYKSSISSLTESSKRVKILEQKISTLTADIEGKDKTISSQKDAIHRLTESRKSISGKSKSLNESLHNKDSQIKDLRMEVKSLTESLSDVKSQAKAKENQLVENLEELKKDSAIKHSEYSKKLTNANNLVEKYKRIAKSAIDKYIESQAVRLGVKPTEIRNKLSENFSFNDIDRVCEGLQEYKVNISKLPFDVSQPRKVKMSVTESVEPIKPVNRFDDELDEQLKALAGL